MIPGVTSAMRLVDRLVARWEVSSRASLPFLLSGMALVLMFAGLGAVVKVTGVEHPYVGRAFLGVWFVLAAVEGARFAWTLDHPYATPRWLHAVHRAVGEDVAVHALAELMRRYDHDPAYVVTRFDLIAAVRDEEKRRREATRRAEGFRLMEAPAQPDLQAQADAERRRRARARRAAREAGNVA